jgi:ATP-dependent Clp protease ATP-binding subunit ClpC
VIRLAQEEAQEMGYSHVGTEHVLIGLLLEGDGQGGKILRALGVSLEGSKQAIANQPERSHRIILTGIIPTSRVETVLDNARHEALDMQAPSVGSEHLLLGLLMEHEGVGAQVLEEFGVDSQKVRDAIFRLRA